MKACSFWYIVLGCIVLVLMAGCACTYHEHKDGVLHPNLPSVRELHNLNTL